MSYCLTSSVKLGVLLFLAIVFLVLVQCLSDFLVEIVEFFAAVFAGLLCFTFIVYT